MNRDHDDFKRDDCGSSCKPVEIPTEDEREALDALRTIKDRVREIKKRLADLRNGENEESEENEKFDKELQALRAEWKKWEIKRDQAARERMIRLGHIEPD